MITELSPSWAMSGQALDARADTHLVDGLHYRVLTNPLLGLPVAPLIVRKQVWRWSDVQRRGRTEVTWVDDRGAVRTPPFFVTPDNPVTGTLPTGEICCWARLEAKPGGRATGGLSLRGMVATPGGDATVAVSSRPPFDVYASHLERLVVRGTGTVTGLTWLPAATVTKGDLHTVIELPTGPGARYAATADGYPRGVDRAKAGAPTRFGLHESPTVAGPAACPPAEPDAEAMRVVKLAEHLRPVLKRLIDDVSAPQTGLSAVEPILDATGRSLGTSTRLLLPEVLQAAVDPGLARWLGFLGVDGADPEPNTIVLYRVDAVFAPDWKSIDRLGWRSTLPAGARVDDATEAVKRLVDGLGVSDLIDAAPGLATHDHLVLGVVLAATVGRPLDVPAAPGVDVTGLDATGRGVWLPGTAPQASRELIATLGDLVPGAGLASALAQPGAAVMAARNPPDEAGRGRLLTAGRSETAFGPDDGVLHDRAVDERAGGWQVAQLDWFGRWSAWTRRGFPTGVRPRPPAPVLTLTTRQPVTASPPTSGPLAGVVRVEVAVPPLRGLPAGGRLLSELELSATTAGGVPAVTAHPLADPTLPPETLVVQLPGPALLPTRSDTVTVVAHWRDSAGVRSEPSPPRTATLHDPRPPVAVTLPPTLTYTSRPDAAGRAETTLSWTSTPDQAYFRIFVADETTLRAKLAEIAAGGGAPGDAGQAPTVDQAADLLAALAQTADDPARGAVWDAHKVLLPRRWWQQLTRDPLPRAGSGTTRFTHTLSGSLAVLVLYRVVSMSTASVESDFPTSPLLPRRVPNALVPAVPAITVRPSGDATGNVHATITVDVPVGPTPAVAYRLRRATASTEPALMPIVAEGLADPPTNGQQRFHVTDTGSGLRGPRDSLRPWLRYQWRVEVQGPPAPGGGPAGEWSRPCAAVSTVTTPVDPPAPVSDLVVVREADAVHVRFTQPESLAPGATTGYAVDVYRQRPGEALRLLRSTPGQAPPPVGRGADPTGSFDVTDAESDVPAGTAYRVVVTDPIGRSSAPSPAMRLP